MNRFNVLSAAEEAVSGRGDAYAPPEDSFARIACLWTAHMANRYNGTNWSQFDIADVAIMMTLLKIARLENDPKHMDSWIDIAGYAACGGEIAAKLTIDKP